jgi:hypothetical protein
MYTRSKNSAYKEEQLVENGEYDKNLIVWITEHVFVRFS